MNYFSYDHTKGEAPVLMQCCTDIDDVQQQANKVLYGDPEENSVLVADNVDVNQTPVLVGETQQITEFTIVDLGTADSNADLVDGLGEDPKSVKKGAKTSLCCNRKTFVVLSLLLASCLIVSLIAAILRSQRDELESSRGAAQAPVEDDSQASSGQPWRDMHNAGPSEKATGSVGRLVAEGGTCSRNNDCESGICHGNAPPYLCQAKHDSCHLCNDDSNCLSGRCVRRSGKSVCASTEDGKMEIGCFCDLDEDCSTRRCEGEPLMYTCQPRTIACTSDLDCFGVCNNGQCSDGAMGSVGKRQPTGDRCSGHADCSSGVCVGFGSERDGMCSEGKIGGICRANDDCISERCIQGYCEPKQVPGGACKGNGECASGLCIGYSGFNNGLCLDTSPDNSCQGEDEACSVSGTCRAGFCKSFQLAEESVCLDDSDCLSDECSWSQTHAEQRCS